MAVLRRWSLAILAATTVVAAGAGDSGDETYEERRARIEDMGPGDKKQLLEKQQRFEGLSPEKQAELKELHGALQAHENRDELTRVMNDYYEWVRTLSGPERARLDSLSPGERVAEVIRLKNSRRWSPMRFGGPGGFGRGPRGGMWGPGFSHKDSGVVRRWAGQYVAEDGETLADILPPEHQEQWNSALQKALAEADAQKKEEALWRVIVRWYLAGPKQGWPLAEDDIKRLDAELPHDITKHLKDKPLEERIRSIQKGVRFMAGMHFLYRHREENLITPDELEDFRRSDLDPQLRQRLEGLPSEDAKDQLRHHYVLSKMRSIFWEDRDRGGRLPYSRGGPGARGGGPGRGRPPGSSRGPGGDFRGLPPDNGFQDFEKRERSGGKGPGRD
jgi:hypothetical protein